ncbi:hypothetical protein R1sor_024324 [Riccia sorocarpa]|uniref:Cytochrome c-553 n=1 Tax=Riccia sorocarpa TaxID=122646 RepID=A0ABD3GQZ0_9MARC
MATFSVLGSIAASPDTCVSPVLKSSPGLLRSPVSVSAMSSRISSSTVDVRSCRREGDDGFSNGSRSHSDDPYTKILSTVTAFGASALLASTLFNVEAAGALDRVEAGVLFQRTCSGCHSGGSNILQPSATLYKKDLDRNGLTSVDEIYKITYYGKGRMPGYGEKCTPRGQCTFGPRLGDDDIRALAEFVKSQAEEGWRN